MLIRVAVADTVLVVRLRRVGGIVVIPERLLGILDFVHYNHRNLIANTLSRIRKRLYG
jgi:hypothetical protein